MKISCDIRLNLKTKEVQDKVKKATQLAMRDTVVDIHQDALHNAVAVKAVKTGHNNRSIASEVSGMGVVKKGEDAQPERVVKEGGIEGAVYSTSGYGGFL